MAGNADPWLELVLQFSTDEFQIGDRRSDRPRHVNAPGHGDTTLIETNWRVASDLPAWITETTYSLGDEEGPHATGPRTLPVFLDFAGELRHADAATRAGCLAALERLLADTLGIASNRFTVALAPPRRIPSRRPFELPIRVVAHGTSSVPVLERVRAAEWYREAVPDHGIALEALDPNRPPRGKCDVFACDALLLEQAGATIEQMRPRLVIALGKSPNLASQLMVRAIRTFYLLSSPVANSDEIFRVSAGALLEIVGEEGEWLRLRMLRLDGAVAEGYAPTEFLEFVEPWRLTLLSDTIAADPRWWNKSAVIWTAGLEREGEFVLHLLEGVIHDLAIHQAFEAALRQCRTDWNAEKLGRRHAAAPPLAGAIPERMREFDWPRPALLVADRAANQNLRMRDAAFAMFEKSLDAIDRYNLGNVEDLLRDPAVARQGAETTGALAAAKEISTQMLDTALDSVLRQADFTRERVGLAPRAAAAILVSTTLKLRDDLQQVVDTALGRRSVRTSAARLQQRRVNVRLLRLQPRPGEDFDVPRSFSLVAGAPYRLRINLGRLGPDTLVVGESPPIDTLLPDPETEAGHLLSVVVDGLDFTLKAASAKRLELPRLGASKAVSFDIVAPIREGPARLRILVYLERSPGPKRADPDAPARNHLVQSLLLRTTITEDGDWLPGDITTAKVEFSKTARFANLDSLGPRSIAITLNTDPSGEGHSVMLKVGSVTCGLSLSDPQMTGALKAMRRVLRDAAFLDPETLQNPRLLDGQSVDERQDLFDGTIRKLAADGAAYWSGLFLSRMRRKEALLGLVRQLAGAGERTIQVVPLDTDLFPWAAIYDAPQPAPDAPVCRGFRRTDAAGAPLSADGCLSACLHPDRSKAYCLYGFWGARNVIDQNIGGAARDAVAKISPGQGKAVHVSVGLPAGPALALADRLAGEIGAHYVRNLTGADDVVDILWNHGERPAVLVIVGHAEPEPGPGDKPGVARITLPGVDRWLHPRDLNNRLQRDFSFLENPSPIVVLAACDTASADLSTFVDFIRAFDGAGAAAIVGVEIPILQQDAARIGERLTLSLFRSKSLAEAVLAYRRDLFLQNNPLGFVVTSFGDARFDPGPQIASGGT